MDRAEAVTGKSFDMFEVGGMGGLWAGYKARMGVRRVSDEVTLEDSTRI